MRASQVNFPPVVGIAVISAPTGSRAAIVAFGGGIPLTGLFAIRAGSLIQRQVGGSGGRRWEAVAEVLVVTSKLSCTPPIFNTAETLAP